MSRFSLASGGPGSARGIPWRKGLALVAARRAASVVSDPRSRGAWQQPCAELGQLVARRSGRYGGPPASSVESTGSWFRGGQAARKGQHGRVRIDDGAEIGGSF